MSIIDTSGTSIESLTERYRSITSNLANVSTNGYKRRVTTFEETLAETSTDTTETTVTAETSVDFSQGGLTATGRPLDMALQGDGFFIVETPEGPLYTRNGAFRTNAEGQLVDLGGGIVSGRNGPITIPADTPMDKVHITRDGMVRADGQDVGQLRVVQFESPEELLPAGSSNYTAPEGVEPIEADNFTVQQGYRESSNVNAMHELVDLIAVTRLYEANIKSMQKEDETSQTLIQTASA